MRLSMFPPDGRGVPDHTRSQRRTPRVQLQLPRALVSRHFLSQRLCDVFQIGSRNWRWTGSPRSCLVSVHSPPALPFLALGSQPKHSHPKGQPLSHTFHRPDPTPRWGQRGPGRARCPGGENTVPTKEGQAGAPRSLPLPPYCPCGLQSEGCPSRSPPSPIPTTCPGRPGLEASLEGVGPVFPFHVKGDRVALPQPRHSRKKEKQRKSPLLRTKCGRSDFSCVLGGEAHGKRSLSFLMLLVLTMSPQVKPPPLGKSPGPTQRTLSVVSSASVSCDTVV